MYKIFKYLNVFILVVGLLVPIVANWPLIKLWLIEKYNDAKPGPIVFNIYLEIFPPNNDYSNNIYNTTDYAFSDLKAIENSSETEKVLGVSTVFDQHKTVLEIPSLEIKGPIVSGVDESTMLKGFWHYPNGANLTRGGNLVFVGHRFLKLPPAKDTFFNLDKIKKGAKIYLKNDLGTWEYTVISKRIVDINSVQVLLNTKDDRLTLITCHPVWTSKERLVVIAKPVKLNNADIY